MSRRKKYKVPVKDLPLPNCLEAECRLGRSCQIQGQCVYGHPDLQLPHLQESLKEMRTVKLVLRLLKSANPEVTFPIDTEEERERIWAARNGYSQLK